MKRLLLVLAISIVILASAAALDLNINLGLLSGVGVSHDVGLFQFGLDIESSAPVFAIASGIMDVIYEEQPFWDGFVKGLGYFVGADIYAYIRLFQVNGFRMQAGLDVMMGTETYIDSFETVLKPSVKLDVDLGERCGLFLAAGFSLLDIMYVPGFEKPLVRIPRVNYATILTGSRIGLSIDI